GPYSVRVTNIYAAVVSANAALTVNPDVPPVFTTQPLSQSVHFGRTATFTVTVSGTPPFNYQWATHNGALPGATNSALAVSNVQPSDADNYDVVVSNSYGSLTSAPAALFVDPDLETNCVFPPSGLVGWWPAEGNGSDLAGTNNATVYPSWFVPGEVGQALSLP